MTNPFDEDDPAVAPDPVPNEWTPFRFPPDEDGTGLGSDDDDVPVPVVIPADDLEYHSAPANDGPDPSPEDDLHEGSDEDSDHS
jgi:hypothetical protein